MIYIVSGHPRSGTTMMMQALEAAGLEAAYDSKYSYELSTKTRLLPGFPEAYEDKLVKSFYWELANFPVKDYKIVFMLRESGALGKSFKEFGDPLANQHLDYYTAMEDAISKAENRKDMEVFPLWYEAVLDRPLEMYMSLKSWGLPIDPEKAASIVDPSLCHWRK